MKLESKTTSLKCPRCLSFLASILYVDHESRIFVCGAYFSLCPSARLQLTQRLLVRTSNNVSTFYSGNRFSCSRRFCCVLGGNDRRNKGKGSPRVFVGVTESAGTGSQCTSIYQHGAQSLATHPQNKRRRTTKNVVRSFVNNNVNLLKNSRANI